MTHAQALWYTGPGQVEIRDEILPAGEVVVHSLYSGISRGTERLISNGRVPVSEYGRMRCPRQQGDFPFPVKYGYATVGVVEDGPANLLGKAIFALFPHQSRFDLPPDSVRPLPAELPGRRAVLAANMETALNGLWDLAPARGDRIAVVGAGVVGALVGHLCQTVAGAEVTLVDIDAAKSDLAAALGLAFATPATARGECAAVVHTSASAAGLETALNLAGDEATVLEMSWYGAGRIEVALGGVFHSRRLKLVSSQVGKVSPSRRQSFTYAQRLAAAIDLLADARLDALLAPAVRFADLADLVPGLLTPGRGTLCQVIDYP